MKSRTTERILSETPQEIKDKVRDTTDRQIQLLQLGLEPNEHQRVFEMYKYDKGWAVDFHEIVDYDDSKWNTLIDDLIYDITEVKKQYYADLKESDAYVFAQKETEKVLRDTLNKYKSLYKEETRPKLFRTPNYEKEVSYRAYIEIIIELQNKLCG